MNIGDLSNYTSEELAAVAFVLERMKYLYGEDFDNTLGDDWTYAFDQMLEEYAETH